MSYQNNNQNNHHINLPTSRLNEQQKGIALIVIGVVLLLYTLNVFLYSGVLVGLFGAALIAYGLIESGLFDKVLALIKKPKHK